MCDLPVPAVEEPKPLRASFLKIERAQQHLAELEKVANEFFATNPAKMFAKIHATDDPPGFNFQVDFRIEAVPGAISSILGDIFHNLRSSLDLMAAELCRSQNKLDDDVYFPFSGNEADLDLMIKKRNFNRAGEAAVRLLKELKPYKGGNIALRAIHDFNIQDKHRELIVNMVSAISPVLRLGKPGDKTLNPFIEGDPNAPSEVRLVFPDDCALAGNEVIPTLHELVQMTAGIIESFKPLATPALQPPVIGDGSHSG